MDPKTFPRIAGDRKHKKRVDNVHIEESIKNVHIEVFSGSIEQNSVKSGITD